MKKTDLYLKPGTYIKSNAAIGDIQGISLENFVVSVLNNPTCCAKPVFIKDGLLMTDTSLSTSLQTVKDQVTNSSPLKLSTTLVRVESNLEIAERLNIEADSTVTTQTSSVIQSSTTNANLVIAPDGTGALISQIPDGTTNGGNARGQYSVDLQRFRTFNTRVASGNYSSIIGGASNSATGSYSVSGGQNNQATGVWATAIGGGDNTATGNYSNSIGGNLNNATAQFSSVIGGASNTASSSYSTVSGGQSNTASTNTHATVVGGNGNTASGQHSTVIGGLGNTASGVASIAGGIRSVSSSTWTIAMGYESYATQLMAIALGREALATGTNSIAIGGNNPAALQSSSIAIGETSVARSPYSVALGAVTNSYLYNQFATLGGTYSQASDLKSYKEATLTTSATTVLSLDGTGTTNLIIPNGNNRAWNVTIDTIAVVTAITGTATGVSVGDCYRETKQLLFKRIGGTSSIVGTVDTSAIKSDSGMSTAIMTVASGGSQEMALTFTAPTFTGGGSVTCRVVSKVMLVEVAY